MPPIIIFVEGNIGTGKTTFLTHAEKYKDIKIQVLYEPVEEWKKIGILGLFYSDPKKYAYLFQSYCLHTRFRQLGNIDKEADLVLIERSIFCDKNVFACACVEINYMNAIEMEIYNRWFDYYKDNIPYTHYHLYLRCDPLRSKSRIRQRSREEEESITLTYLTLIHNKHEEWLNNNEKSVIIDANENLNDEDSVFKHVNRVYSIVTDK